MSDLIPRHGRRAVLRLGLTAGALGAIAACGGAPAPPRPPGPPEFGAALRMSMFGTATRQARLQQAFAGYVDRYGGGIDVQVSANTSYAQKLATEMAGGAAAEVVSLFHNVVADYARREQLVDLNEWADVLDVSALDAAAIDGGVIAGRRVSLPMGDNAFASIYDRERLAVLGVVVPEPGHTWEEFARFAGDVSRAAGDGYWGTVDASGEASLLEIYLRQRGAALYDDAGRVGFTPADLTAWFELWDALRRDGAAPPAGVTAESLTGGFGTSLVVAGAASNFFVFGNVLRSFQGLTPSELVLSTPPMDDQANSGLFVRASNWMSAYNRGPNVDDAVNAIQFLTNDPGAVAVLGVEFGAPPNLELRSELSYEPVEQAFVDYVGLVAGTYAQPVPALDVAFPEGAAQVQAALLTVSQSVASGQPINEGVDALMSQAEGWLA